MLRLKSGSVADSAGNSIASDTDATSVTISSPLTITTPSSGLSGTVDTSYSLSISASGGTGSTTASAARTALGAAPATSFAGIVKSDVSGNLSAASSQIRKKDLPNTIANKKNLIYDTTASNLGTLQPILDELKDNGYDVMMIMVYAHPIVSFLRNYKRERKVPAVGVIGTWANVYSLIEDYKRIFGDNFVLVSSPAVTPEEFKEIENFQKAYDSGKTKEYFDNLLSTGEFKSTFKKSDVGLSPEELAKREKQREATRKTLDKNIEKLASTYGDIQTSLNPTDVKDLPSKINAFVK